MLDCGPRSVSSGDTMETRRTKLNGTVIKSENKGHPMSVWQAVWGYGGRNCVRLSLVLVLSVFAIPRVMAGPQIIAGIEIDYPAAFERLKPEAEEARQRNALNRWRAAVN